MLSELGIGCRPLLSGACRDVSKSAPSQATSIDCREMHVGKKTCTTPVRSKLTPPEVARRWGISPEKVISWIQSGELRAMDASAKPGGRPRYLIDIRDLEAFEMRRSVTTVPKTRRQRKTQPGVIQYF